jgi:phage terminase small subunit
MRPPTWLHPLGKDFWKKHYTTLADRLDDANVETFAVLCEIYALMRETPDPKQKKNYIDAYVRLATQFGLTPRSAKLMPARNDAAADPLKDFLDS